MVVFRGRKVPNHLQMKMYMQKQSKVYRNKQHDAFGDLDQEPPKCLCSRLEFLETVVEGLAHKIQNMSQSIVDLQADKLELSNRLEKQIELQVTKKSTEICSQLEATIMQKFLALYHAQIKKFTKAFQTLQYHFWCPPQHIPQKSCGFGGHGLVLWGPQIVLGLGPNT